MFSLTAKIEIVDNSVWKFRKSAIDPDSNATKADGNRCAVQAKPTELGGRFGSYALHMCDMTQAEIDAMKAYLVSNPEIKSFSIDNVEPQ